MAYSAASIISDIGIKLFDTGNDIWTKAFIASAVSEAQHLIVSLRPDANATNASPTADLTSKQTLPTGGLRLLDVVANQFGAPIQRISKEKMTKLVPAWTTETGSAIEFFMFDEENPTVYWVYPKPTSNFNIDIVYSALPTLFGETSATLGISDIYITAILEWVLYRCLSMQSKSLDLPEAVGYRTSFYNSIGAKTKSDGTLIQVQS